jgi:hypothetical protein
VAGASTAGDLLVSGAGVNGPVVQDSQQLATSNGGLGYANMPVNIQFTGNIVLSGVGVGQPRPADSLVSFNGATTGTCDNAGQNCPLVDIVTNVGVVSVGASIAEGYRTLSYIRAAHNGSYVGADFIVDLLQTTAGSATNKNYIGGNFGFIASASDLGNGFAAGFNCIVLGVSVTTCSGSELDISIESASSVANSYGHAVLLTAANRVAATNSAAFALGAAAGGTPTLGCALCDGYGGNNSALAASADFIGFHGAGTAPNIANGFNASGWTISGYLVKAPDGISGITGFGNFVLDSFRQLYLNANQTALGSYAPNTFNWGGIDSAMPQAQTFQNNSVVAGTPNGNGVNLTIVGSLSTGSGTPGDLIFQTGATGGSGTSQNAAATALTVKGGTRQVVVAAGLNVPAATGGTATKYVCSDASNNWFAQTGAC